MLKHTGTWDEMTQGKNKDTKGKNKDTRVMSDLFTSISSGHAG